jgi:hypothetical protein
MALEPVPAMSATPTPSSVPARSATMVSFSRRSREVFSSGSTKARMVEKSAGRSAPATPRQAASNSGGMPAMSQADWMARPICEAAPATPQPW